MDKSPKKIVASLTIPPRADKVTIYFDGACSNNGSKDSESGCGAVVIVNDTVKHNISKYIGRGFTNNQSEYRGLIEGLKLAYQLYPKCDLTCIGDSQLVIKQMKGEYKCKHPNMIPLHKDAKQISSSFTSVVFQHVLRDKNSAADALANKAVQLKHYKM